MSDEKSRRFLHSSAVLVFDAGPLAYSHGGVDFGAVRGAIAGGIASVPAYRRKLRWIPLENHPVWVDDPEFRLDYHVRHTSLPHPGSAAQLRKLVSRLMSARLHRSRPMWECWVVEGLEGGRFALVGKVHNCMIEGDSGADLFQALLTPDADHVFDEPPPFEAREVGEPRVAGGDVVLPLHVGGMRGGL